MITIVVDLICNLTIVSQFFIVKGNKVFDAYAVVRLVLLGCLPFVYFSCVKTSPVFLTLFHHKTLGSRLSGGLRKAA